VWLPGHSRRGINPSAVALPEWPITQKPEPWTGLEAMVRLHDSMKNPSDGGKNSRSALGASMNWEKVKDDLVIGTPPWQIDRRRARCRVEPVATVRIKVKNIPNTATASA